MDEGIEISIAAMPCECHVQVHCGWTAASIMIAWNGGILDSDTSWEAGVYSETWQSTRPDTYLPTLLISTTVPFPRLLNPVRVQLREFLPHLNRSLCSSVVRRRPTSGFRSHNLIGNGQEEP